MAVVKKCVQIGAAAFALGLSLAGPHVGVAAADRSGGDGTSAAGSQGPGPAAGDPTPGRNLQTDPVGRRGAAAALSDGQAELSLGDSSEPNPVLPEDLSVQVVEPDPRAATTAIDSSDADADGTGGVGSPGSDVEVDADLDAPVTDAAVASEETAIAPTEVAEKPNDSSAGELVVLDDPSDSADLPKTVVVEDPADLPGRGGPQPMPWWRTTVIGVSGEDAVDEVPSASNGSGPAEEPLQPLLAYNSPVAVPVAAPSPFSAADTSGGSGPVAASGFQQAIAALSAQVTNALDAVSLFVSDLPANPFTDFLSGALLLVRRGLFNQLPTARPGVLVGELLRPLTPIGDGQFSSSLAGRVVGSLGARDPEGGPLTYTITRAPEFGTVEIASDGSWVYTPNGGVASLSPDVFTVAIGDGGWNIFKPNASPVEVSIRVVSQAIPATGIKPGLIASDWLEIVSETRDTKFSFSNGDEPVMLSIMLTTTLGVDGSTNVRLVDGYPNEIGSGLDAGNKVPIPNEDGDAWIDYRDKFKPLTWQAWDGALTALGSVKVTSGGSGYSTTNPPTVRFEGGLRDDDPQLSDDDARAATGRVILAPHPTDPDTYGNVVVGVEITDPGRGYEDPPTVIIDAAPGGQAATAEASIGRPAPVPLVVVATLMLEGDGTPSEAINSLGFTVSQKVNTVGKVLETAKVTGFDFAPLTTTFTQAKDAVKLTGLDYAEIGATRVGQWLGSGFDPDDPVAVGVTAMIPVDGSFLDSFLDPRGFDLGGITLDDQYMYSTSSTESVAAGLWKFTLAQRFGLLVPPSYVGGKPQGWVTTYAGDYADNAWAEWKVETQAWPQVTW
jgi:hypothetical protein